MDNETEKILKAQMKRLPKEIITFISSASWGDDIDEISSLYNLSVEDISRFEREVNLVLVGLTHPDEFRDVLEQEVGLQGAVLDAIVSAVEQKIFAPIRPALVSFFEKEAEEDVEEESVETPDPTGRIKELEIAPSERPRARTPDVAPDNLPIANEIEPLIPPIPPKFITAEGEASPHPFEEKMKRVFTAGQQSMGEFTIEAPAPQTPKALPIYHVDPYREAIE